MAAYYRNSPNGGCVTSLSLAAYIHVTVNRRFGDDIRLSYSKTEIVDDFEALEHELVREAMRITGVTSGVEITTIADIPSRGTGLGSSSAVTVGLLNALHTFAGRQVNPEHLAAQACQIEIETLGQLIGMQDQYGCAMGGVNHIRFIPDGSVRVEPLDLEQDILVRIENEFTLLYSGRTRSATKILQQQSANTADRMQHLDSMCQQAELARDLLLSGDLEELGRLLHEGWSLKKELASGITIPEIDSLYQTIIGCGASGGKLLGAGGGGFILFHGDNAVRQRVAEVLPDNKMLPLKVESSPSLIIFDDRDVE